MYAQYVDTFRH